MIKKKLKFKKIVKKKVLVLHNRTSLKFYLNSKKKYDEILVIDHLTAIDCYNLKIKFIYIKNKMNSTYLAKKYIKCFECMYDIDLKIRKKLKSNNKLFYSNYAYLNIIFPLILFYEKLVAIIIKLNLKNDIYYFNYKCDDHFDFFLNTISIYKNKNLHSIKIKSDNSLDYELLKLIPKKDEYDLSLIKKYLFKILFKIKENNNYKKNILFLNLQKNHLNLIENNKKKINCNLINFDIFFLKENFNVKIKFNNLIPDTLKKNVYLYKLLKKYLEYIWPYVSDEVLSTIKSIEKLNKKYNFKTFITSHPGLKANTIINYFNNKNISSFCMLHGGTVGHFKNYLQWPRISGSNMNTNNKNYYQTYSENQRKVLIKDNKQLVNPNNIYFIEKSNIKIPLIKNNKKNFKNKKLKIGYVLQSNYNVNYSINLIHNDPFNLFLLRTKLLKKINQFDNIEINASGYNIEKFEFASKEILAISQKKKLIKIYNRKFNKLIENSDLLIFETAATTSLVQAFLQKKNRPILLLDNTSLKYEEHQKKLINKSLHLFKNFKDLNYIIDCYLKNKLRNKNLKHIQNFTNTFYGYKSQNNLIKELKNILREN